MVISGSPGKLMVCEEGELQQNSTFFFFFTSSLLHHYLPKPANKHLWNTYLGSWPIWRKIDTSYNLDHFLQSCCLKHNRHLINIYWQVDKVIDIQMLYKLKILLWTHSLPLRTPLYQTLNLFTCFMYGSITKLQDYLTLQSKGHHGLYKSCLLTTSRGDEFKGKQSEHP